MVVSVCRVPSSRLSQCGTGCNEQTSAQPDLPHVGKLLTAEIIAGTRSVF